MASPLLGVAGVNSLLFGSFVASKKIVSPYPNLTIAQTALAGAMAGAITSTLAGPVEMFKIKYASSLLSLRCANATDRMQGQYGSASDKKLSQVASDLWREWGFRNGIMRGFWVTVAREIPAYAGQSLP